MKLTTPRFRQKDRLARYIAPEHRKDGMRAKPPAFMEGQNSKKDGLSVNSLEVESINQIAKTFSAKFNEKGPVGISIPTIQEYNEAANHVGLQVLWSDANSRWEHQGPSAIEASFVQDPKDGNRSHCLVKFTLALNDYNDFRFACSMARKPTYRMV